VVSNDVRTAGLAARRTKSPPLRWIQAAAVATASMPAGSATSVAWRRVGRLGSHEIDR